MSGRCGITLFVGGLLTAALQAPPDQGPGVEYVGMCDASAAVAVDAARFLVASDEDNTLRVYWRDQGGGPVSAHDLSGFLELEPEHREVDLEGAARLKDRVYWIGSHSASKEGKPRPNRRRLFATDVRVKGGRVVVKGVGRPYRTLIEDMHQDPHLKAFDLPAAAERPPKEKGGLSIEGLAATPDGALLIGFRNPILPGGKALLVPLLNPGEVTEGKAARFGGPIDLDLQGRGVRSIDFWESRGKYVLIAGSPIEGGTSQLYQWSGRGGPRPELISSVDLGGLNPEAIVIYPGPHEGRLQLLSDDGARLIAGDACKDLAPAKRRFRSVWVSP